MNPIPTPRRVAATLSKGYARLPLALCLLVAVIAFTFWQIAKPPVSEPSTKTHSKSSLPIGSGTFNVKLGSEGGASK